MRTCITLHVHSLDSIVRFVCERKNCLLFYFVPGTKILQLYNCTGSWKLEVRISVVPEVYVKNFILLSLIYVCISHYLHVAWQSFKLVRLL